MLVLLALTELAVIGYYFMPKQERPVKKTSTQINEEALAEVANILFQDPPQIQEEVYVGKNQFSSEYNEPDLPGQGVSLTAPMNMDLPQFSFPEMKIVRFER